MTHPLVLALYPSAATAAAAASAMHGLGVTREHISVVARNHEEEGDLAERLDASPGADIEDSRPAARLGELSGKVLAAIAVVMPGVGPIVAAGPLAAGLGEAAGHVAGGLGSILTTAGAPEELAERLQQAVEQGAILLGVHAATTTAAGIQEALQAAGATRVDVVNWPEVEDAPRPRAS